MNSSISFPYDLYLPFIGVTGGIFIRAVYQALNAPSFLRNKFGDDIRRTHAAIVGNHLISVTAEIIFEMRSRLTWDEVAQGSDDERVIRKSIEDTLGEYKFRTIRKNSEKHNLNDAMLVLVPCGIRWCRYARGWCALPVLVGAVITFWGIHSTSLRISTHWLVVSGVLFVIGYAILILSHFVEAGLSNRVVGLFDIYELDPGDS